jgi:beta-galactosidase
VQPFARVRKAGGQLELLEVTGRCQVYVDGKLLGQKTTDAPAPLRLPFPAGLTTCRIGILCTVVAGQPQGLTGAIRLRQTTDI